MTPSVIQPIWRRMILSYKDAIRYPPNTKGFCKSQISYNFLLVVKPSPGCKGLYEEKIHSYVILFKI